jgi:hypothetical protein
MIIIFFLHSFAWNNIMPFMQVNTKATVSYNKVVITLNKVDPVDETTRSSVKRLTIPAQISSRISSPLTTCRRIR